jgi:hypothetical protein
MGYELRRWLAPRLPRELSTGERIVALEVADLAHEETRIASPENAVQTLAVRCGFADVTTVGRNLTKLAKNGVELRIQIGKGQNGQPVYAARGREMTFYVPTLEECPALLTDEQVRVLVEGLAGSGKLGKSMYAEKVGRLADLLTHSTERSAARPTNEGRKVGRPAPKGRPPGLKRSAARPTPTSHSPQDHSSLSVAERIVTDYTDVADADERDRFITWMEERFPNRGSGWWMTSAHDMPKHLAAYREQQSNAQQSEPPKRQLPPVCDACRANNPHAEFNARWRTRDGQRCPDCHPDAQSAADAA